LSSFRIIAGARGSSWILHAPHSSTAIPAAVRKQILLDDDALRDELNAMTD
jgi:N-formylglutamate deformylase